MAGNAARAPEIDGPYRIASAVGRATIREAGARRDARGVPFSGSRDGGPGTRTPPTVRRASGTDRRRVAARRPSLAADAQS
jgi:hypothetical protein